LKPQGGWPPNPFDFSAPARGEHFAGRSAEKAAVDRFLGTVSDSKTAHLLLHGRRGIGKTSLLGELGRQARDRGLVIARMAVDATSSTDREFFTEAVRTITDTVLRDGGLGGIDGEFADAVERATLGREVAKGLGPLRVIEFDAATRGSGARVPDSLILSDLEELVDAAHELDRLGIMLVVDEADQLAREDATVQRVRNLLVLPGVISTVLAGTEGLVAAVDNASAPIGRHFVRLELPPLADRAETRDLLSRPLITAELDAKALLPTTVVAEIHALTNGRPFEVALLGHAMYEDLTSRDGDDLRVNESVLDSVVGQVHPSPEDEAALAVIRSLDPEDLRLAARYCVDPILTIKEHALLQIAFEKPLLERVDAARHDVASEWTRLTDLGLAHSDGLLLTPAFGELSQTYLKYRARRMDVLDAGIEGRYSDRLAGRVQADVIAAVTPLGGVAYLGRSHIPMERGREPEATRVIAMLRDGRLADFASSMSPLADVPTQFTRPPEQDSGGFWGIALIPFEIGEDGFSHVLVFESRPGPPDVDGMVAAVASVFERAKAFGVEVGEFECAAIDDVSWSRLGAARAAHRVRELATSLWYAGRRDTAHLIMRRTFESFEAEGALAGDLLEPQSRFTNNLAFMELASGHVVEALELFTRLAAHGGLVVGRPLSDRLTLLCNLAAATAGSGRHVEAIAWADECLHLRSETEGRDVIPGVLAVYLPDPEWPKMPRLVENPDPFQIALATKAAALAAIDDDSAVELAREVADAVGSRWPSDVLEAVGRKLRRPDVIAEAERYRQRASEIRDDSLAVTPPAPPNDV
jgi:DNA polymerase III delta prime subunit